MFIGYLSYNNCTIHCTATAQLQRQPLRCDVAFARSYHENDLKRPGNFSKMTFSITARQLAEPDPQSEACKLLRLMCTSQ